MYKNCLDLRACFLTPRSTQRPCLGSLSSINRIIRAAQTTRKIDNISHAEDSAPMHDGTHAWDAHPVPDESCSGAPRQMIEGERWKSISNRQRRVTRDSHGCRALAPAHAPVSCRRPRHTRVSRETKQRTTRSNVARTSIRQLIEVISHKLPRAHETSASISSHAWPPVSRNSRQLRPGRTNFPKTAQQGRCA